MDILQSIDAIDMDVFLHISMSKSIDMSYQIRFQMHHLQLEAPLAYDITFRVKNTLYSEEELEPVTDTGFDLTAPAASR